MASGGIKTLVMAGGYTVKHLMLKALRHQVIPPNTKIDLYLSSHFTETIHKGFEPIIWGQNYREFPDEGKRFLAYTNGDITAGHIKTFNKEANEYLESLDGVNIYEYEPGTLKISETMDGNGFKICAQSLISCREISENYNHISTNLLSCISTPNYHERPSYRGFENIEDFLERKFEVSSIPLIIFGYGASAMWLAEICMRFNQKFMFISGDPKVIQDTYKDNDRNLSIANDLEERHFRPLNLSQYSYRQINRLRGMPQFSKVENEIDRLLEMEPYADIKKLIFLIDKKTAQVVVGRPVICWGFSPYFGEKLSPKPNIMSLAINADRSKEGKSFSKGVVGVPSMLGSVQTQIALGWQSLGEMYGLTDERLIDGVDFHKLFFVKSEQELFQRFFLEKHNIHISDSFFEALHTKAREIRRAPKSNKEAIDILLGTYNSYESRIPTLGLLKKKQPDVFQNVLQDIMKNKFE